MVTSIGKRFAVRIRSCIHYVASLACIACLPLPALAQSQDPWPDDDYYQVRDNLAIFYRQLKELRQDLDEQTFNPGQMAELLGGDEQALFEFVRDEVAFQPYEGVMRRAPGTLMSMAGNAFDQSLLLGSLLKARNIEVRYAFATLSSEQVSRNIALQIPRGWAAPEGNVEDVRNFLPDTFDVAQAKELREALETIALGIMTRDYWYDYMLLDDHLRGTQFDPRPNTEVEYGEWLPTATRHCWVQANIGGKWVDMDPTVTGLKPGESITTPADTSATMDANVLTHKLNILIELETSDPKAAHVPVLSQTVNLQETVNHVRLFTTPNSFAVSDTLKEDNFFDEITEFQSGIIINGVTIPGEAFDLSGELISQDARIRNAQKVSKAQQKGFGALNSGLGGLFGEPGAVDQAEQKEVKLLRVWVTLDLVSPSGKKRSQRRVWAERRGDSPEQALKALKLDLLPPGDFLTNASVLTPTFATARRMDILLSNREAAFTLLNLEANRPAPNTSQALNRDIDDFPIWLLDLHVQRSNMLAGMSTRDFPGLSSWSDGPMIVMQRSGGVAMADGTIRPFENLDIVFNTITSTAYLDGMPLGYKAELSLRQGLIDTQLEYQALGGGDAFNTHTVIRKAKEAGTPLTWIAPGDESALQALAIEQIQHAAIKRDLDAGYAVLLAERPFPFLGADRFAWWRVNPTTGETLGMADRGAGASMAQKAVLEAKKGAQVGMAVCLAVALWQQQGLARSVWEYGKCVAMSALAGAAGPWVGAAAGPGGHLLRSGAMNAIVCSLSVALDYGRDAVDDRYGSPPAQGGSNVKQFSTYATNAAICTGVGMAIGGISYAARSRALAAAEQAKRVEQARRSMREGKVFDFDSWYTREMGRPPIPSASGAPGAAAPPSPGPATATGTGAGTASRLQQAYERLKEIVDRAELNFGFTRLGSEAFKSGLRRLGPEGVKQSGQQIGEALGKGQVEQD
jgi:hypothetical protein